VSLLTTSLLHCCYCSATVFLLLLLLLLLQVMTREPVSADDVVIKQGDEGDKFYVVDSGCFAVSVIDRKVTHTLHTLTLCLQLLQLLALIVSC
jgi:CRP-like cAMP-binding protein